MSVVLIFLFSPYLIIRDWKYMCFIFYWIVNTDDRLVRLLETDICNNPELNDQTQTPHNTQVAFCQLYIKNWFISFYGWLGSLHHHNTPPTNQQQDFTSDTKPAMQWWYHLSFWERSRIFLSGCWNTTRLHPIIWSSCVKLPGYLVGFKRTTFNVYSLKCEHTCICSAFYLISAIQ